MNTVDSQYLVGLNEIAQTLHVARNTVQGWSNQRRTTGMPEPVARIGAGPIFDMQAVAVWWRDWVPMMKRKKSGYLEPEVYEWLGIEPLQEETSIHG